MKFPRPFTFSLILFTVGAGGTFAWRATLFPQPDFHSGPSRPGPAISGKTAAASLQMAASVPTVREILRMSLKELKATATVLSGSKKPGAINRLMLVCSRLAELDPAGGPRALLKFPDGEKSGNAANGFFAMAGFLSTWLADDSRDPAELLRGVTDPRERESIIGMLGYAARSMGISPAATTKITALLDAEAVDMPGRIFAAQAESGQSPENAVARLLALPESEDRNVAVNDILRRLAEKHPADALRLAEKAVFNGGLSGIMGHSLEKLVKDQPMAALDYIVSHPGPVQATDFLNRWDYLLAAAGPEAVLTAAAKVEDGDIRRQIIGYAAVGMANTDPAAAARLMEGMEADELVMPLWRKVAAAVSKLPRSGQ